MGFKGNEQLVQDYGLPTLQAALKARVLVQCRGAHARVCVHGTRGRRLSCPH